MQDEHRRIYQCDLCGYQCKFRQNLRRHRKTHEAKSVHCDHCPYTCRLPQHLRRHLRLVHSFNPEEATGPLFVCATCPFATGSAKAMGTHCARLHDDPKPWRCSRCEYRARSRCIVRYHEEQVHERRRPFRCETCGLAVVSRRVLAIHRVVHSPDPTPYRCDRCTYGTRFLSNLTKHMIVHTDAKPFECSTCDMRFARKANLKTHISKAHRRCVDILSHALRSSGTVLSNPVEDNANSVVISSEANPIKIDQDSRRERMYSFQQDPQQPLNDVLKSSREMATPMPAYRVEPVMEHPNERSHSCGEMAHLEVEANETVSGGSTSPTKAVIDRVGTVVATTTSAVVELQAIAPKPTTISNVEISCALHDPGVSTLENVAGGIHRHREVYHEVNCRESASDYCSTGCEGDCLLHCLLAL